MTRGTQKCEMRSGEAILQPVIYSGAIRTIRILRNFKLAKTCFEGVINQKSAAHGATDSQDDLDGLHPLQASHDTRKNSKHTCNRTIGCQFLGRRFREETMITGALGFAILNRSTKDANLSLKAINRAVDIGNPQFMTGGIIT